MDFWKDICRDDFFNIILGDEIIVRRTINLKIKILTIILDLQYLICFLG